MRLGFNRNFRETVVPPAAEDSWSESAPSLITWRVRRLGSTVR
jgi:hypothetical protein